MFRAEPKIVRVDSVRRQRTIKHEVNVAGFGLWSGVDVVYSFRPAAENSGIRFFRDDLPNSEPIPALVNYRIARPRQTSLANGSAQVDMVEHVLAALRAARIDNCDIVVSAPEAPGLDGSCEPFLREFLLVGGVEQNAERTLLRVENCGVFFVDDSDPEGARIEIIPSDSDETTFRYTLHYDVPRAIPNQSAFFKFSDSPETFLREIAPCRTFLTLEEAECLREMGVCQRVTTKNALVFTSDGILDNELRFDNECARHKILDMIGDFALAPVDWLGSFCAYKTGHQNNAQVVATLLDYCK